MSRRLSQVTVFAALMGVLAGCDVYDRPHRAVPQTFRALGLDGQEVTAETLRGRPWVISFWVPG